MLTLNDLTCPICGQATIKKGRGGFTLCASHGWIKPVRAISLNAVKQQTTRRAGK